MAKSKEELSWLPLNTETLPSTLQVKHKAIRDAFAALNVLKANFQTECDAVLAKLVASWPAQAKAEAAAVEAAKVAGFEVPASPITYGMAALRVGQDGKFLPGTTRKFSYMRGVAVAGASVAKASASKGIALS